MTASTLAIRYSSLRTNIPPNVYQPKSGPAALHQRHSLKDHRPPAASSGPFLLTPTRSFTSRRIQAYENRTPACLVTQECKAEQELSDEDCSFLVADDDATSPTPRALFLGAATLGVALLFIGADGSREALAFGPEGPLVEEFWDNVRRYGLYMLTVSTGVAYAVIQPLIELLKNPISAVLVVVILVGSGFLLSQILSLMFGLTDFNYQYAS